MNKIPSKKIRKHWQPILQAHENSGLSVAVFCARQKICSTSFYARRKQFSRAEDKKPGFLRLLPSAGPVMAALAEPVQAPVSIRTPNGYQLAVHLSGQNGLGELLGILKSL